LKQKLFRSIFWTGYLLVFVTSFIPLAGSLSKIKIGPESFKVHLDQLLHFVVYFLIGIFYLIGQQKGIYLFKLNPLRKFILLILLLATITEIVQLWVPERAFNVYDLVSNLAGVIIGTVIIKVAQRSVKLEE
jgi:VanZ family protein